MNDYIILANPSWYEEAKDAVANIPSDIYTGVPVIEDRNIPKYVGYIICEKVGNTYLPVGRKKRIEELKGVE